MSRSDRALEIAFLLTILHGRFRYAVVGARLAALGDSRGGDLGDDGVERRRLRLDRAGARHVADGAIADRGLERHLVGVALDVRVLGVEHAVAAEDAAAVGEVDRRELEPLLADVLPDVELRPVGDRERPHVLAAPDPAVVQAPELGTLVARVPLAEVVAERQHALLGASALLVAARAAERRVEAVALDGV